MQSIDSKQYKTTILECTVSEYEAKCNCGMRAPSNGTIFPFPHHLIPA